MDDNLTLAEAAVGMSEKIMRGIDEKYDAGEGYYAPRSGISIGHAAELRIPEATMWLEIASARLSLALERAGIAAGEEGEPQPGDEDYNPFADI